MAPRIMTGSEMLDRACHLVEALVFASPEPVKPSAIAELLKAQSVAVATEEAIDAVRALYADHAIEMVLVAGGWQFRTRPEYASALTKVVEKPRRLSRGAMETLAIVAYHQPCTRAEIEAIRGVSLGQAILDALLEDSLIVPKGRKEVPGRPVLWGTTAHFLESFALPDLAALPRREDFLLDRASTEAEEDAADGSAVGGTEHTG
ncbi:SMC-Scp complex subunit ScpB [Gluconobacter kondonii]|uniref:SMC-Scp complex subunit ScpB n=1 Tax=Gluconobacter kondonii TaxID=941463 RepID=UPI001B8BED84|nr:SMC-Scp complex subunit ScpB [Gluconobacter kondonii]MBS1076238.1 SMC-Scp complex subunit ScpB [Gluconobacter kondonii]